VTDPRGNHLIAALPELTWQKWSPHLEAVDMRVGDVLCEPGCTMSHVYFPTTSIVSLLFILENGASAEVAVVGNEGIVGVSTFMGGQSTTSQAVVKCGGLGFRLLTTRVVQEFDEGGEVTRLLLRFTQALITQIAQSAVCNRHHSLDQRLCRSLLSTLDRLHTHELRMTQELIANMLGVRREGVTEAALTLQKAGLIKYQRGQISVIDRPALESLSCECYAVVRNEYQRLLPGKPALSPLPSLRLLT
jgi:CRP-like cAMP-binding protein